MSKQVTITNTSARVLESRKTGKILRFLPGETIIVDAADWTSLKKTKFGKKHAGVDLVEGKTSDDAGITL